MSILSTVWEEVGMITSRGRVVVRVGEIEIIKLGIEMMSRLCEI